MRFKKKSKFSLLVNFCQFTGVPITQGVYHSVWENDFNVKMIFGYRIGYKYPLINILPVSE
jgi:hypothetical protein